MKRPDRPSSHFSKPDPEITKRRRRHKKKFWRKLFGGGKDWLTRLTGNMNQVRSENEPVLIIPTKPAAFVSRSHRHQHGRKQKGVFNRLFGKHSKSVKQQIKPSEIGVSQGQGTQQSTSRHRKKKKSLYKRFFEKKEKKPVKLVLPSNKPQPPREKEQIIYKDYVPYFINSTMMFLLAYLAVWLTYQLAVIFTSSLFHIDSVLYFFEVMFPVGNSSELWSSFNIISITMSGPLISLAAGSLYYVFIVRRNKVTGNRLMFFNWMVIHSFCMFFAAFVAGVVTNQGFGYVANWMYMNVFFKILVSLIFLFSLSWISYRNAGHILETSNSVFRIKPKNRAFFLLCQTILPWFVGTILLVAIKYPPFTPQHENILVYDLIIIVSVLFMIVPPFFNKHAHARLSVDKERKQTRISKKSIIIVLAALIIFRTGLAGGIHFVIQFAMNISRYMQ
jgi:hypothetical protein